MFRISSLKLTPDPVDCAACPDKKRCVASLPGSVPALLPHFRSVEFHDVHVVSCLEHQINPSPACMVFHLYIEAHQLKNDVKYVLIVYFPVTSQFVGNVGKHRFQTLKEIVHLSRHDFFHKTLDLVGRLADAHRSVIWQEEFEESLFHLPVGEAQRVVFEHPVVALDGQVTA